MNAYPIENLKNFLETLPVDLKEHTLSFLPKGHPLSVSSEMEKAFKHSSFIKCFDPEKIQLILSRVWKELVYYSEYLKNECSWDEKNFSKMAVLLTRFTARFSLSFDQDIRWKVRFAIAEFIKFKVINEPDSLDYDAHLWSPISALSLPFKNEFGIYWRKPPISMELQVLEDLKDHHRDRVEIIEKTDALYCQCCQMQNPFNLGVNIFQMISRFGLHQGLIENHSFPKNLQGAVMPLGVSEMLSCTIMDKIEQIRTKELSCFLEKPKSPKLKAFTGHLNEQIKTRVNALYKMIQIEKLIPAGSSDIPTILNKLDGIEASPDIIHDAMDEELALLSGHICVNIKITDPCDVIWKNQFSDGVTWMSHDYRLEGIVDLALKLIQNGYHVNLS